MLKKPLHYQKLFSWGLLLLAVSCSGRSLAATGFKWVHGIPGALNAAQSIAVDGAGNVYMTGSFSGTQDFDPGTSVVNLTSKGSANIFITKTDPSGNLLWARMLEGDGNDNGYAITTDASGNVYIGAQFNSSVLDADPGAATHPLSLSGSTDGLILKLNSGGDFVWAVQNGGNTSDVSLDAITTDASGNVYTGGYFTGKADFDPGTGHTDLTCTSAMGYESFIQKLDGSGNLLWVKQLEGDEFNGVAYLKADGSGNVFAYGVFQTNMDSDPGSGTHNLTSSGAVDLFVLKLNSTGDFQAVAQAGGTEPDWPRGMAMDASGNVYMAGTFDGNADFDHLGAGFKLTSVGATSNPDAFIWKLDNAGSFSWVKQIGSSFPDNSGGVAVDHAGNIYTTGSFTGTMDMDPSPTSSSYLVAGTEDIFITKLDPGGNFVWAGHFNSATSFAFSRPAAIAVDDAEDIYTAGYFSDKVNFDPDGTYELDAGSGTEYFIHKLSLTPTVITDPGPGLACDLFPNPGNGLLRLIAGKTMQGACVTISDISGRVCRTYERVSGGSYDMDLSALPAGVYMVTCRNEDIVYRGKFVKQ